MPTWSSRRSARASSPAALNGSARRSRSRAAASRSTPSGAPRSPGVWAGGDCVAGGKDLTVAAVEDGKRAAESIHRALIPHATDGTGGPPWPIFASTSSASSRRTRSGSPRRRRPTRNTTSCAPSRRAGAAWSGRRSARTRRSSTSPGPRYGAIHAGDRRLIGLNNIELITDRPLEVNLREIKQVKRDWPDRALVVSLMVPCEEPSWKAILAAVEETDCDGVELNFGCPHGMSERGMGSAVGQVPEYIEMVARWCKAAHPHAGDRQAHAQHHRHPLSGARREEGRRRCRLADQHHQLDHHRRPRQLLARALDRRQGHPWRLLRPGGEADRARHGLRDRPRPATAAACRSPASAASPPGATRPSSWRSAPARCRSAPPP